MKIIHMFQLLTLLLCFHLSNSEHLHDTGETPSPVLDTSKKVLETTSSYYILPVVRGQGGGLTIANTSQKSCPLDIIQESMEVKRGTPVKFIPAEKKGTSIGLFTDVNIKFVTNNKCNVWKVGEFDKTAKDFLLTTGGVEGKPGEKTFLNWFKIQKALGENDIYQLIFCPSVCDTCASICTGIGVVAKDKVRHLGLNAEKPFNVIFKKAGGD